MPEPRTASWSLTGLLAEQRSRWHGGDRALVETYAAAHPSLKEDKNALIQLIANEIALRFADGEMPTLEEYVSRFPALAEDLRQAWISTAPWQPRPLGPAPAVAEEFRKRFTLPANQAASPTYLSTQSEPPVDLPPTESPSPARRWPQVPGYEVVAFIDYGGQGEVYRARHVRLDRTVALKILRDRAEVDEQRLARFHREGKLSAQLDHRNIIRIYDYAECEGRLYFSMEFAECGSLKQKLRREGPMEPRAAAELLIVLAGAIQHAHDLGIVHRDLKPGNVLFAQDGTAKIADFGLAKRVAGDATELTQTRTVLGSAGYMAPEQAAGSGRHASFANDVYGLGAVLYAALTGRAPFEADDWLEVLIQVRTQPVTPPSQRQPGIPPTLDRICLKCLEKEPARRYASAAELAAELQGFLDGRLPDSSPQAANLPASDQGAVTPMPAIDSPLGATSSGLSKQAMLDVFGEAPRTTGDITDKVTSRPGIPSGERAAVSSRYPIIPGYEILEELGRGGMGIVYKARQLSLKRIVALKTILGRVGNEEWERLRREAETVASLHHPNIIQVYDLGELDDFVYISMEYVTGGSLQRHLRGVPQTPRAAAQLLQRVAEAVGLAHSRGIVHRDIKPAKISARHRTTAETRPGLQNERPAASTESRKSPILGWRSAQGRAMPRAPSSAPPAT
jgi:serine/threonine protein kinase